MVRPVYGSVFLGWNSGRVNMRRMRQFRQLIRERKIYGLTFEKRSQERALIVRFYRAA